MKTFYTHTYLKNKTVKQKILERGEEMQSSLLSLM